MARGNKFKQVSEPPATQTQPPTSKPSGVAKALAKAASIVQKPVVAGVYAAGNAKRKRKRATAVSEAAADGAATAAVQPTSNGSQEGLQPAAQHDVKHGKKSKQAGPAKAAQQPPGQSGANSAAASPVAGKQKQKSGKRRWGKGNKAAKPSFDMPADRADSAALLASGGGPQLGAAQPITVARFPAAAGADGAGAAGSNWAALRAQLATQPQYWRRKRTAAAAAAAAAAEAEAAGAPEEARALPPQALSADTSLTPVVAVDCEMVGVGPEGLRSELARVSVVNNHGAVLMDKFARPKERVTDFRTRFSGIRPADIKTAPPFEEVQAEAAAILKDRTIVGHSITNDLKALLLGHPAKRIRDTARFPPLMLPRRPGGKPRPRALRALTAEQLGLAIQDGEHSPVDDARAALYLYHKHRKVWEAELKQHGSVKRLKSLMAGKGRGAASASRSLADLAKSDDMVDL